MFLIVSTFRVVFIYEYRRLFPKIRELEDNDLYKKVEVLSTSFFIYF